MKYNLFQCLELELHLVVAVPSIDVLEQDIDNLLTLVQLEQVSIPLLEILEWVAFVKLEYC